MEITLSHAMEAKLARLAADHGRNSESLVLEAVEPLVDDDEWFLREVDKGLAAADRGEFVERA
jgi:predicted transcriptional regulator